MFDDEGEGQTKRRKNTTGGQVRIETLVFSADGWTQVSLVRCLNWHGRGPWTFEAAGSPPSSDKMLRAAALFRINAGTFLLANNVLVLIS